LELVMGSVFGQYSRYLHTRRRVPRDKMVYSARYDSKVVAPMYLPYAVRRAHRSPVEADLCNRRADYPFSSEWIYTSKSPSRWVTTSAVFGALQKRGLSASVGYREFMDKSESEHVAQLFTHGSKWDRRVLGDRAFVGEASRRAERVACAPSRDQVINAVARLIGVVPTALYESARNGVLGRGLVAWYAIRSGAATLSEVGRWFSRSATTLRREIDRYRALEPALFSLNTQEFFGSYAFNERSVSRGLQGQASGSADVD